MSASGAPNIRRALVFWSVGTAFVLGLLFLRAAVQPLLLVFAGILFGTSLRGLAEWTAGKLHIKAVWALVSWLFVMVGLAAATAFWVVPHVADQAAQLADLVRGAYERLRQSLASSPWGSKLTGTTGDLGQQIGQMAQRAAGFLAGALGAIGATVLVSFVALYLAFDPGTYRRSFVRLVPPGRRDRAEHLLSSLSSTLRRWLLGRLASMTAVGLITTVGLWMIGIPLPGLLGIIAGALGFIPNIGPIVSAVPALLLAFASQPLDVVYVLALYLGVNLLDGYVLTPWIQKQAVSLPPALILTAQVVLGAIWGVLGVTLATPLAACAVVIIRDLYVDGALES